MQAVYVIRHPAPELRSCGVGGGCGVNGGNAPVHQLRGWRRQVPQCSLHAATGAAHRSLRCANGGSHLTAGRQPRAHLPYRVDAAHVAVHHARAVRMVQRNHHTPSHSQRGHNDVARHHQHLAHRHRLNTAVATCRQDQRSNTLAVGCHGSAQ